MPTNNVVADFVLTQIGAEQGASALVYRATIVWRDAGQLPASLVFKFPSANAQYREYAQNMGTYFKEVRFYQTFGHSFGENAALPIPRIYFADIDEPTGQFLVVMEDLANATMAQWFSDGVKEVELALTSLAKIHAKFWDDQTLNRFTWLGRADDITQCNQYKNLLAQLLPAGKGKFSNLLSEYSWEVLGAWLDNWEAVRLASSAGAMTLVHSEADMRQMFFPTVRLNRFVLFDWQSPEIGWGAMDTCRMIVTSLSLSARREHEHALVKLYANTLRQQGIHNFPQETLWHQIKLSLLMNVLAHMFTLLWVETEETEVWQHRHLGVLGAALEDWQLLDVINHCGDDEFY